MLKERKRSKKFTNSMIILIIILLSHTNTGAQNVWVREHEPARNLVTTEKLTSRIGFLTDSLCQGRATGTIGNIFNIKMLTGAPLSYATNGQNVPDDISRMDPQNVARQLLGGGN